jgi:hypothetical protein
MMNELYIENFSKQERSVQPIREIKNSTIIEDTPVEIYELTHQMIIHLDRLEKEITNDCKDFTDFRFIFDKIKKKLKAKDVEGIFEMLADLEELIDLGLRIS